MGLWTPNGIGEYQGIITTETTPANIMGVAISPDGDTTWYQVASAAQVAFDVYAISIFFNSVATAGDPRDNFDDIGVDPAGGTSYTPLISNLIATNSGSVGLGAAQCYHFPIFIKAGSSIACRATSSSGGSHEIYIQLFGKPKEPSKTWVGTECIDLVPATPITSGTTSDGAWTSVGTLSKDCHWWQAALGISDLTITGNFLYTVDIAYGDATNKNIFMQNIMYATMAANENTATTGFNTGVYRTVKAGFDIYARIQCSGTPDTGLYVGVWGVR